MGNKYDVSGALINYKGRKLVRIHALKGIELFNGAKISKGEEGGYIEKESNLSQAGGCWILSNAKVYDDARVEGEAIIAGTSEIYGTALVGGKARLFDTEGVEVFDNNVDTSISEVGRTRDDAKANR